MFKRKRTEDPLPGHNYEMTIEGEPMIYSIKYVFGSRIIHGQYFRNKMLMSMIKCRFRSYMYPSKPVVILVKFYLSPPTTDKVTLKQLKAEKTPAVRSFELSEYLLSFQEMIHDVLFDSYKQVVKIDAEKYYSNRPRTVFKFMLWEHYEHFRTTNTLNAKVQDVSKVKQIRGVQSKCAGDESTEGICQEPDRGHEALQGSSASDSDICTTNSEGSMGSEEEKTSRNNARKEAGRRQPRKAAR